MHVERSALVPFPATRMFELVNDVARYPERFRWCSAAEVYQQTESSQHARLSLNLAGLSTSFSTRNLLVPGRSITLQLEEGPFRSLHGRWDFLDLDETGCKVALSLQFEFSNGLLALALRRGFAHMADRLVDDFVQCAWQLRHELNDRS